MGRAQLLNPYCLVRPADEKSANNNSERAKMLTTILVFLCALLCLYLSYKYAVGRPEGFPPGPPRIPFFGSYLFLMMVNFKYLQKAAQKFSQWYKSDIIGFHIGPFPVVVVHSMEGVREVLFRKDFDGRPQLFLGEMRDPDFKIRGIFFGENDLWKEQRRFMLRHLRDFGFGRRLQEFESIIQEEIGSLLDLIRNGPRYEHEKFVVRTGGYKILLPNIFGPFVFNCLLHIFYNDRYLRHDQASTYELVSYGMNFQRTADDYGKLLSIMPWIRYIFPNWSSYNVLRNANGYIYNYFEDIVNNHLDKFDENDEHSFINLYIKKMKDDTDLSDSKSSTFNREQFIFNLIDFSFPAFTAIGIQISLLIQYILLYPEVKTRIQKEIDDVVGDGRLPTLDDRREMHYTEATIREILRIETLVPSGFPHKALMDTELMGYHIPKDTVILTSLSAFHADKRVWGDPETFRPERFLDKNNRLSLKKDVSLPFGAGKRLCAGETFARNILFLVVAALCQNFDITTGPEQFPPDLSKNLNGLVISPPDFWLQLQERKL